ncbi:Lactamase-B domain-containing protein [Fusarium sp. LHS14.1]|nr:Lactamase-B domain-containing protein [Fusarium sp. LHS14.1]
MGPPGAVAKVSLLNTCFLRQVPTAPYVQPIVHGHGHFSGLPCLVFLIQNFSGRRVLFDLGTRKDWRNLSPMVLVEVDRDKIEVDIQEDVVYCLRQGGIAPHDIEAVVLRNKTLEELDFNAGTTVDIGPFKGVDFFGDGSFYIVNAPGHTLGHIYALTRTTTSPDTFLFMRADSWHHNAEDRPSCFRRIPRTLHLEPSVALNPIAGLIFKNHLQFADYVYDVAEAKVTITKLQHLDSFDNVFVVLAHDDAICPIVPLFPTTMNDWKSQGWHDKCRWAFLKDFRRLWHAK